MPRGSFGHEEACMRRADEEITDLDLDVEFTANLPPPEDPMLRRMRAQEPTIPDDVPRVMDAGLPSPS
jgi:hypothetical protein